MWGGTIRWRKDVSAEKIRLRRNFRPQRQMLPILSSSMGLVPTVLDLSDGEQRGTLFRLQFLCRQILWAMDCRNIRGSTTTVFCSCSTQMIQATSDCSESTGAEAYRSWSATVIANLTVISGSRRCSSNSSAHWRMTSWIAAAISYSSGILWATSGRGSSVLANAWGSVAEEVCLARRWSSSWKTGQLRRTLPKCCQSGLLICSRHFHCRNTRIVQAHWILLPVCLASSFVQTSAPRCITPMVPHSLRRRGPRTSTWTFLMLSTWWSMSEFRGTKKTSTLKVTEPFNFSILLVQCNLAMQYAAVLVLRWFAYLSTFIVMVNFEANLAWSVFGIFWKRLFGLNPNFVGWRRKAC